MGKRFGGKKQIKTFFDRPLFLFTMQPFINSDLINEIILVISDVDYNQFHEDIKLLGLSKAIKVVAGGETRQQSVYNGLLEVDKSSDLICVHDAVRPFISSQIISNCLSALSVYDASAPIISSADSLVKWDGKKAHFINRSEIQIIQTPQCFKKHTIIDILKSNLHGTDEIGMLLRIHPNSKIKLIEGDLDNIKITSQNDLNYFSKTNI